ncbi:hypothetical protein OXX69_008180 [Metschnikowia pulcherrima]
MSRELSLERELEQLNALNQSVDSLLSAVTRVSENVNAAKSSTDNSAALLEDWISILNQTRFANNALRNPQWKGTLDDTEDEMDSVSRKRAQLEAELLAVEAENERLEKNSVPVTSPKKTPKRPRR